jgi:hypothetical protein
MSQPVGLVVRTKQPDEIATILFDFANKFPSGVTLTGFATSSPSAEAGVTIDASSISGHYALVQVSGGTLGSTYKVTARVNGSNGDRRELDVMLRIAEEN